MSRDAHTVFEAICEIVLRERGVTRGKMFGASVLKIKGKVFAILAKGTLMVKLPKDRVAEMVASKKGVHGFHYATGGRGRIMKEWVAVAPSAQGKWLSLLRDAKVFVASLHEGKAADMNVSPRQRCEWANTHALLTQYHDKEWGAPVHHDRKLFEFLVLESAQAGLSWLTVLRKRENYRKAFAGFDPKRIARFTQKDITRLLNNPGIIRNRLKIEAAINNAKRFLDIQRVSGSFSAYMWSVVGGKPMNGQRKTLKDVPAVTKESEAWAKDLKKRGFKFLGPTVCYAHMQAVGMVNDHTADCFRYRELTGKEGG